MVARRVFWLLAILVLSASAPFAESQSAGRNEVRLAILAYHPFPDPQGDPFGFATPLVANGTRDWMATYYDGYWFPTVAFDGVDVVANQPDATNAAFQDAYRKSFEGRASEDAVATVSVMGRVDSSAGFLQVLVEPRVNIEGGRVLLRVALFEDDVFFTGKNGVDVHRFTVRAQLPERELTLSRGVASGPHNFTFTIPRSDSGVPSWATGRLGAVAYLQVDAPPTAPALAAREVVQSAAYTFRQDGPTVQVQKAVLFEMYTATWCTACVFGDGAMDLLAEEFGIASTRVADERFAYFVPPRIVPLLIVTPLAALAIYVLVPRRGAAE